jgi:hypothetical protein
LKSSIEFIISRLPAFAPRAALVFPQLYSPIQIVEKQAQFPAFEISKVETKRLQWLATAKNDHPMSAFETWIAE